MGYPPNRRAWGKGDLVIHAADAKRADMLMRVTGHTRDGYVKTRYLVLERGDGKIRGEMVNLRGLLLDPADFGIVSPTEEAHR